MLRGLFKRSGIYSVGLAFSTFLGITIYIFLARHFGPDVFGTVMLFVTLSMVITTTANFGLVMWYQKHIDSSTKDNIFCSLISTRTYTLLLSILVSAVILYATHSFSFVISTLFLIRLIPESYQSVIDGYYLEKGKPLKLSLKNTVKVSIFAIGFLLGQRNHC